MTKTELGSAALVIAVKAEVINIRTLRQHCNVAKYEANCSLTNVISLSGSSREGPYVVAANTAADLLLNVRLLHGLANYIDRIDSCYCLWFTSGIYPLWPRRGCR